MKSREELMSELFEVYYQQCPNERIEYTAQEDRNGFLQSWIVMQGIELSHMMYQGEPQKMFMCNRYCPEYGDDTYYFKTFKECEEFWKIPEELLAKRIMKMMLTASDMDGNNLSDGDKVVLLDTEGLEDNPPSRGTLLEVVRCEDVESNYIRFAYNNRQCAFFGHRVLKIN